MIYLKYATASQEVVFGPFVDSIDGDTEETGLTIANTDIKLWKSGATTLANKNSGGATHISNGIYYATLDATDTNTYGPLIIFIHESGALVEKLECMVMNATAYDAMFAASGTGTLEANVTQVSGDSTAADNLELDYDGTGYNKSNSTIGTTTTNTDMRGTDNAATAANLSTVDTNVDAILVDTGTTIPAQISALNDFDPAVDVVANVTLVATTTDVTNGVTLDNTATSAQLVDDVWDEVLTGATHNVATSAGRRLRALQDFQGYEDGSIWIDTINGTAGTTDYENGTVENAVNSWADALTLNTSLGFNKFRIKNGSSITLTGNSDNFSLIGEAWTLALASQSIVDIYVSGASVSGIATGVGSTQVFENCIMGACTHIKGTYFVTSGIAGTQTVGEAGDYFLDRCYSSIAGNSTWVWDFGGAIGNTNLNMRNYSGGVQIENMNDTGTDTASIEGQGQIIEGTCTGGAVSVRGAFTTTGITNITLTDGARYDQTQILDAIIDDSTLIDASSLNTLSGFAPASTIAAATDITTQIPNVLNTTALGNIGIDWANVENPASTVGLTDTTIQVVDTVTDVTNTVNANVEEVDGDTTAATNLKLQYDGSTGLTGGLFPSTQSQVSGLNDLSAAQINAEVVDALATDTYAEPGQGALGATVSLAAKINYLYKFLRNQTKNNGSITEVYNDGATVVDHKATTTKAAGTTTRGELVSGP